VNSCRQIVRHANHKEADSIRVRDIFLGNKPSLHPILRAILRGVGFAILPSGEQVSASACWQRFYLCTSHRAGSGFPVATLCGTRDTRRRPVIGFVAAKQHLMKSVIQRGDETPGWIL